MKLIEFDGLGWLLAGAGIVGAMKPLCNLIFKIFQIVFKGRDWVKAQDDQTEEIEKLKKETSEKFLEVSKSQDEAIKKINETHNQAVHEIKEEQTLIIYGTLACLKGLAEQGCDGPVHDAIDRIDKYLNKKAHE